MEFDFDIVLKGYDGKDLRKQEEREVTDENGNLITDPRTGQPTLGYRIVPLTLKDTATLNLMRESAENTKLEPEKRYNLHQLCQKIFTSPACVDLTIEELAEIKSVIGRHEKALAIMGAAWDALESAVKSARLTGEENKKKKKESIK